MAMKEFSKKIYGDAEGPFGFPMRSDVASVVERLVKDLNGDCKELVEDGVMRISKVATIDANLEPRTEISFVTTDSIDRDAEVVMQTGMDWTQWRKNPTVTWAHKYDQMPIGRGLWVKKAEKEDFKGFLAKTRYLDRPQDWNGEWFPDGVWHAVKNGFLAGKSIGFLPLEVRPPNEKEILARPELAKVSRLISKTLILEYAVCPVQCNPTALLESVGKGFTYPQTMLDDCGVIITEQQQNENLEHNCKIIHEPKTKTILTIDMMRLMKGVSDDLKKQQTSLVSNVIDSLKGKV